MLITETSISGAFAVTPQQHRDDRGVFLEWFRSDRFVETTGHRFSIEQANCSVSSAGTIRGIHFAQLPPSQAKYVTCPSGAVLDVVVDLRTGSPTYGEWDSVNSPRSSGCWRGVNAHAPSIRRGATSTSGRLAECASSSPAQPACSAVTCPRTSASPVR